MADFSFSDWARIDQAQPDINKTVRDGIDRGRADNAYNKAQDALARVRANPNDRQALTDLAVYDPTSATAYAKASEVNRQQEVRSRTSDFIRSNASDAPTGTLASLSSPAPVAAQEAAPLPLGGLTPAPAALAPVQAPVQAPLPALTPAPQALAPMAAPSPLANLAQPALAPMPQAVAAPVEAPASHSLTDISNPALIQAGAAVASGKMTANEALARLAAVADPQEITQALAALKALDQIRLDRMSESNNAMAVAAQTALSIPDDATHAGRKAFLTSQLGALSAHGVTADHASQVDLSDAGLHGVIGQAIGITGLITQANKERDDARLDSTLAETVRHNGAIEGKPVIVPWGATAVDPRTGKVIAYSNTPGANGSPAPTTGNATADAVWQSIIHQESGGRAGVVGSQTQWGTAKGKTQLLDSTAREMAQKLGVAYRPDLMTGKTPEAAAYQEKLGRAYYDQGLAASGGDPAKAAAYYFGGPSASMHGPKTAKYVREVLSRAGGSSAPTSQTSAFRSGPIVAAGMTQDALDNASLLFIADRSSVLGRDKITTSAIQNNAARLMKERNITTEDVIAGRAGLKIDTASGALMQKSLDGMTAYERTTIRNGEAAVKQAGIAGGVSGVAAWNRWVQAGRRGLASPQVAALDVAINTFATEYAKAIGGGAMGNAALTDSARHEALEMFSSAMTQQQLTAALGQARIDMKNRHESTQEQMNIIKGRIRNAGHASAPSSPPAIGTVRGNHVFRGGNPADRNNWATR